MKTTAAFIALLLWPVLAAGEQVQAFDQSWDVQRASDWSVEDGMLRLRVAHEPPPDLPRRPTTFALSERGPFRTVTVEAEIRRNGRSLLIVYAWQDADHYNYAHISSDTGAAVNVHNGMFHVFGGERVRVSPLDGPPSLPDQEWTPVKLVFDGLSGHCYVEVKGERNPSLDAFDLSLRWGRVGLGSFNETGDFRNVRISGELYDGGTVGHR